MSVFFTLQHGEGDGATTFANADLDNYEIAAFVNGELRGVGEWQTTEVGGETKKWGYIRIRSNVQSGETVTFKYYDKTEQKEKTVYGNTGKIDFGDQDKIGEASAPHGFDMDNNVLPGDANDDGKVNINTASAKELTGISGIGETRANAIITYRENNGAFASIEDIKKVPGIKDGLYGKIKDQIRI